MRVEQPIWALMVTPAGGIVRVRREFLAEKTALGWTLLADEADVLQGPSPQKRAPMKRRIRTEDDAS